MLWSIYAFSWIMYFNILMIQDNTVFGMTWFIDI